MASAAISATTAAEEDDPLSWLADDFVEEGPSESRIIAAAATGSSSASSKPSLPHKSLDAPEYVRRAPPPLSKDSDEYWLARAQRRAHQQPPSQPSADGTAASRVKDRRARAPRVKKGRRGVFMRWMLDTFHLKEQLLAANVAVAVAAAAFSPNSVAAGVSSAAVPVASPSCSAAAASSSAPPPSPSPSFPHLVDVAGGRGQVAFMLCAFHGMRVSVIDPVDMSLGIRRYSERYHQQRVQNSWQSRQARERGAQQDLPALQLQLASSAASSEPVLLPNGVRLPVPWLPSLQHFQCMFPDSISLSLHKQYARPSPSPAAPSPSPSPTSVSAASDSTAATGEESASEDEAVQDFDADESASFCCAGDDAARSPSTANDVVGTALVSSSVLASTLASCALLYGMHADGATEALVDYALAHNKPFAVVPCCVFPGAAPHRLVRRKCEPPAADSAASTEPSDVAHAVAAADELIPVRSYEQFLDYLQAKHPSIQRANLSFEGRNTVLYRTIP